MKKYIFTFIIALGTLTSSGQNFSRYFSFYYEPSIPLGSEVIADNTSWWGGGMRYQYPINNQLYLGFEFGWNSFSKYIERTTYQLDHGAITTDLYAYSHNVPLSIRADYFIPTDGSIIPYAGLSVGMSYSDQSLYFSHYEISESSWGFVVRPQIGALISLDVARRQFIDVGIRYSYNPQSFDIMPVSAIQYLSLHVGYTIPTY